MNFFFLLLLCAVSLCGVKGQEEGQNCITNNGASGVCVNSKNCASAQAEISKKVQPKICKFLGEDVIVCCESAPQVTSTTADKTKGEDNTQPVWIDHAVTNFNNTVQHGTGLVQDTAKWPIIGAEAVLGNNALKIPNSPPLGSNLWLNSVSKTARDSGGIYYPDAKTTGC